MSTSTGPDHPTPPNPKPHGKNLRIAIVGAGIAGLTTALALSKRHFTTITIYETATNLGFVGAGIQLAPNMARILDHLDCWTPIRATAVDLQETSIRRADTDEELGHVDLRYIAETYGYPHMVGHRASLIGSLYESCLKHSEQIRFCFSSSVVDITAFAPTVKFRVRSKARDGEGEEETFLSEEEADVLIAADGIRSSTREKMLQELGGMHATVLDTNQAAYRILLKRQDLLHDPELLALINGDKVTRWIGEKRHIIAYPISSKQIYNISTVQPDTKFAAGPSATYTTKGSKSDMLQVFSDFCPKVQRMLDLVPEGEVCEWKLRVHSPLPTWTFGCVVLVGDACHPTLPHLAQGAALAIEDAAVLAVVLARLPDRSPVSIGRGLRVFEVLRKERAEMLVELAAASGRALHLGEGAAKEERDRQFKALKGGKGSVPDKWADADVQRMIYGHDCVENAEKEFAAVFESLR